MLSSGDKIGPYTIRERAGQGGMAIVFKAWHEGLHRFEALKVPRGANQSGDQIASDSAYIQRLLAEARVAAGLHHPNIVAIHGVSEPLASVPYFAMDWVEGRDLAQILAEQGAFSLVETVQILEKVASALDYAHGRGVVHRDIKPANILLAQDNGVLVPKVVDFGISRAAEDDDLSGETKLTRSGMIVGTPEYMSPEQAGSGEKVDFRTDIYSLGILAYEMLCGAPPFTAGSGVSRLSILISHVRDVAPLWEKFPDFPPETGKVILRALAKMPGDRPASCAAFIDELRATSKQNPSFFVARADRTGNAESTPFDESRFNRDESATIFERPISLSDTPPPGPPPTIVPPQKALETALEVPLETPTGAYSQTPPRPSQALVFTKNEANETPNRQKKPAQSGASRIALLAGISGVLVGGALVLALLGRGADSSQVAGSQAAPSIAPANSGLESAVALPLETKPVTQLPDSPRETSKVAPPIAAPPVATPRLRVVKVKRTSEIAYATQTRRSASRARGTLFLAQRGQSGVRETTLQISYRGAREMARRTLSQRVVRESKDEIVVLGTRAVSPPPRITSVTPARIRVSRPILRPAPRKTDRMVSSTRPALRKSAPRRASQTRKSKPAVFKRRAVREAPLPP